MPRNSYAALAFRRAPTLNSSAVLPISIALAAEPACQPIVLPQCSTERHDEESPSAILAARQSKPSGVGICHARDTRLTKSQLSTNQNPGSWDGCGDSDVTIVTSVRPLAGHTRATCKSTDFDEIYFLDSALPTVGRPAQQGGTSHELDCRITSDGEGPSGGDNDLCDPLRLALAFGGPPRSRLTTIARWTSIVVRQSAPGNCARRKDRCAKLRHCPTGRTWRATGLVRGAALGSGPADIRTPEHPPANARADNGTLAALARSKDGRTPILQSHRPCHRASQRRRA